LIESVAPRQQLERFAGANVHEQVVILGTKHSLHGEDVFVCPMVEGLTDVDSAVHCSAEGVLDFDMGIPKHAMEREESFHCLPCLLWAVIGNIFYDNFDGGL
jgi:hypothetical protein